MASLPVHRQHPRRAAHQSLASPSSSSSFSSSSSSSLSRSSRGLLLLLGAILSTLLFSSLPLVSAFNYYSDCNPPLGSWPCTRQDGSTYCTTFHTNSNCGGCGIVCPSGTSCIDLRCQTPSPVPKGLASASRMCKTDVALPNGVVVRVRTQKLGGGVVRWFYKVIKSPKYSYLDLGLIRLQLGKDIKPSTVLKWTPSRAAFRGMDDVHAFHPSWIWSILKPPTTFFAFTIDVKDSKMRNGLVTLLSSQGSATQSVLLCAPGCDSDGKGGPCYTV